MCGVQDLPQPDFMLKDPAERTEEEIRAAMEFEKKEAAFLEEREKLKKALEGELRKLQSTISQAMENFDERLRKLFQLKINTEMAMHQVHVHVCVLSSSLPVGRSTNEVLVESCTQKVYTLVCSILGCIL